LSIISKDGDFGLTIEELRRRLDYDPKTGIFKWRRNPDMGPRWNGRFPGKIAGYINLRGYCLINLSHRDYLAHRLAWFYVTGRWPENLIDHKNSVVNDNRFDNLRESTQSQNMMNRKPKKDCLKGVFWDKARNKWRASIQSGGVSKYLGRFDKKQDAYKAYCEAAEKYHGQFARLM